MDIEENGHVYIEIRKGMYGLKEACILAFNYLVEKLAPHGYYLCLCTPGLQKHKTRKTTFTLCGENFGIKYHTTDDLYHLFNALKTKYEISIDYKGNPYIGLKIIWEQKKGHIDISMPNYVMKALQQFQYKPPQQQQPASHK